MEVPSSCFKQADHFFFFFQPISTLFLVVLHVKLLDEHSKRTVSPIPDMLLITSSTSSFSSVTRLELWEKKLRPLLSYLPHPPQEWNFL